MFDLKRWTGVDLSKHRGLYENAKSEGYAVLTFCQYGVHTAPLYVAVMIKRAHNPEQKAFWAMTRPEFKHIFDQQVKQGWGLVLLSAHGPANGALFAGVFEKRDPILLTTLELTRKELAHKTLQAMNAKARTEGLRPLCIASYGEANSPRFAAIWQNNTGPDAVLWNNDGTLDSADTLEQRNAAQSSNWCRPVFLTLNKNQEFCSVYEASDVGRFEIVKLTDSIGYELAYQEWVTEKGFLPICVQAAGEDAVTALFSAIFVERDKAMPRVWSATGGHNHTDIESNVRAAMTNTIIRQASVAIVFKKRLVYARGFNMAESNWPQAEPTTHFRLASCSKSITALAIFQLIEEGKLKLSDRMQDILKLKTPAGDEPTDPKFKEIMIQHLLEHSSGLPPSEFDDDLHALTTAFNNAGKTVSLPVSAEDTDSFIATLSVQPPGRKFVYNNCGYYLLGRVVKQLRGTATPIDAYQKHLFDPLHIARIRRAKSLIADQQPGEARYQDPLLAVGPSVFPGKKLVPTYYGTYHLEILDGDGGLTGAAVDVARLVAILTSQDDSPALKRSTIVTMFEKGAAIFDPKKGRRSGFGFDAITDEGNGQFFALKGGALTDAHSVIEIGGDWGSVSLFAAADAPNAGSLPPSGFLDLYAPEPDRDSLMDVDDLFPQYGMPSL
jgi:CubicO group peptidase (beta-lactamase class C family)